MHCCKSIDIIKNTSIIVKILWIRFPNDFGNLLGNFDEQFQEFYKNLGSDIPKYLEYEGEEIQYIFCIDRKLDINTICDKFGIKEFSTSKITVDKEKFNYCHQIHPTYDDRQYILSSTII
jgi:hypothetical protein